MVRRYNLSRGLVHVPATWPSLGPVSVPPTLQVLTVTAAWRRSTTTRFPGLTWKGMEESWTACDRGVRRGGDLYILSTQSTSHCNVQYSTVMYDCAKTGQVADNRLQRPTLQSCGPRCSLVRSRGHHADIGPVPVVFLQHDLQRCPVVRTVYCFALVSEERRGSTGT